MVESIYFDYFLLIDIKEINNNMKKEELKEIYKKGKEYYKHIEKK